MRQWQERLSLAGACVLALGAGAGGVAWGVQFGRHHPAAYPQVTVTRTVTQHPDAVVRIETRDVDVPVPGPTVIITRTRTSVEHVPQPAVTVTRDVPQPYPSPVPAAACTQPPQPQPSAVLGTSAGLPAGIPPAGGSSAG